MKNITTAINLVLLTLLLTSTNTFAKVVVKNLTAEYHQNPIGIDVVRPRLSWQMWSDDYSVMQSAYEIRVAENPDDLKKKNRLIWSSGKIVSDKSVNIVYEGRPLVSMERVYWQVRVWDQDNKVTDWSEPAFWENGLLEENEWTAEWITNGGEVPQKASQPAHYYRKEFDISKKVKRARVYATSLGLYMLYLNGERVGDQLFTPGWTSYNKRLQYQVYDVTESLQNSNTIAAIVGDGWYRGWIGWKDQRNYYGEKLGLLVQLEIEFEDGKRLTVQTGEDWKVSQGPILESDIYNGEVYDANLEMEGWSENGFDESNWSKAAALSHKKSHLIGSQGVPVRAVEEIQPIAKILTPRGEHVIDMGQNMVGWVRLRMSGSAGDTVRVRFAEVLDRDGNFYTDNLRSAKATDTYIFKEDGIVEYEPHFTFHGFRYLRLEDFKTLPNLEDITGVVIYSDMPKTGEFYCSNELINQLQQNIQWGQKGNFLDVPTDCPQRDERLGWTGDAQVFSMTAAFNFNVAAFYTKWMKDLGADQNAEGRIPHVIPDVLKGNGGATGWADAVAIIPWTVYQVYDDTRILKESYPYIEKWVEYMKGRAGADHLWMGDSHFGDWLAFASTSSSYPGATTEKDLIATAYYCYTTKLLAKISRVLGKKEEEEKYKKLAEKIKEAFIQEFVTPNGRLVSHTQTAYALVLSFELLPDHLVDKAAAYLAQDVKKFRHLTTGFLGTPLLCKTLSGIGRDDLAFMLLNRKEYPSWLYPVTQGATTIWERWDGQKPDGTFQNVGMNSFNHYAYGAIGEWLYSHVAGIQVTEESPGYKQFVLAPHIGGRLTKASAELNSAYGVIRSAWELEDDQIQYEIEIPANTSASVILPGVLGENIILEEIEKQVSTVVKVKDQETKSENTMQLGSGKYRIKYTFKGVFLSE